MSPPIYTTDEIELDGMEWPTVSLEEAWNRSKPYSAYVDCANHWVLQARFATEAEALDYAQEQSNLDDKCGSVTVWAILKVPFADRAFRIGSPIEVGFAHLIYPEES